MSKKANTPRLEIYSDKSILYDKDNKRTVIEEGVQSSQAKKRLEEIKNGLESGFLDRIYNDSITGNNQINDLSREQIGLIESLVNSVDSEKGRAIVALTILQLAVKCICPQQSIRLHKGNTDVSQFSWTEGISMRSLGQDYIIPFLRKKNLLFLNISGFMMTRTLAENYPYTELYKAQIRGAKKEWLDIVDAIENKEIDNENALKQLFVFLYNKSEAFGRLTEETEVALNLFFNTSPSFEDCIKTIKKFVDNSTYSARVFEVAMHSLIQVLYDINKLNGFLLPLSQMRSANKKHGNIGDVEISEVEGDKNSIIEAWDAKYGKPELRDELEELSEKLINKNSIKTVGFVTNQEPDLSCEIEKRINCISQEMNVSIFIFEFDVWVDHQLTNYNLCRKDNIGHQWLKAISDSICQKKRDIAPIDEPTMEWVKHFKECIS
jgi:hypothetical protein